MPEARMTAPRIQRSRRTVGVAGIGAWYAAPGYDPGVKTLPNGAPAPPAPPRPTPQSTPAHSPSS